MRAGSFFRWLIGLIGIGAVLGAGGGCADMAAAEAFRADAAALRDDLDVRATAWRETLDRMEPRDPARPSAQAELAHTEAAASLVGAGVARIDQVLAEATKPTHPITETAGTASPLLPVSLRGPLLLGAAGLVAGLRAWRLKAGLTSVARGLSAALREDEEFRACFQRHADTFRATQTPTAKRVVDEVTAGRAMVRLPV